MKKVIKFQKKEIEFQTMEDKLRYFVVLVDRGERPPERLLKFMAEGAREFLCGGKPWQKGKGGRPKNDYGDAEIRLYLLHYYGSLSKEEIGTALDLLDPDGKDRTRTIDRAIKRGELAFCMAKLDRIGLLKSLFGELLALDLGDLSEGKRRKCLQGLRRGLSDLELVEGG